MFDFTSERGRERKRCWPSESNSTFSVGEHRESVAQELQLTIVSFQESHTRFIGGCTESSLESGSSPSSSALCVERVISLVADDWSVRIRWCICRHFHDSWMWCTEDGERERVRDEVGERRWSTCGIFSHRLTDSIDVFDSKPMVGRCGQPENGEIDVGSLEWDERLTFHVDDDENERKSTKRRDDDDLPYQVSVATLRRDRTSRRRRTDRRQDGYLGMWRD